MNDTQILNRIANRILLRTQDAFSYKRYGRRAWIASIKTLLAAFPEDQVEILLRSKLMRVAADAMQTDPRWVPHDVMAKYLPKTMDYALHILNEVRQEREADEKLYQGWRQGRDGH